MPRVRILGFQNDPNRHDYADFRTPEVQNWKSHSDGNSDLKDIFEYFHIHDTVPHRSSRIRTNLSDKVTFPKNTHSYVGYSRIFRANIGYHGLLPQIEHAEAPE